MFKTRKSHLHTLVIAYLLLPPRCWLVDSCKSAGEAAAACATSIGSSFPWLDDGLRRSLRIQPTDAFKDKPCHVNTIVVTNNADYYVPIPSLVEPLRLPRFPPKRCLLLSFSLNLWADMASAWTTEPLRKRGPSSPPQLSASLKWRKWICLFKIFFFFCSQFVRWSSLSSFVLFTRCFSCFYGSFRKLFHRRRRKRSVQLTHLRYRHLQDKNPLKNRVKRETNIKIIIQSIIDRCERIF